MTKEEAIREFREFQKEQKAEFEREQLRYMLKVLGLPWLLWRKLNAIFVKQTLVI